MKEIKLTKGYVAFVSDEDFDFLNQFKWHALVAPHTVYAARTIRTEAGGKTALLMHRAILRPPDRKTHIDHIDGNGLNNQRDNIRLCSQAENNRNIRAYQNTASKFKGVSWHAKGRKWTSQIVFNGEQKYLGLFKSEMDAAAAYNYAANILHGEFARLNDVHPLFLEVELGKRLFNANNTSGFRGIYFVENRAKQWAAQIGIGGGQTYIGSFSTPEEAARAFDAKAREIHGDNARLNFPI